LRSISVRIRLPIPRLLKEPEGCRFSSLRRIRLQAISAGVPVLWEDNIVAHQPAARESTLDSSKGVSIHGVVGEESRIEPILLLSDVSDYCMDVATPQRISPWGIRLIAALCRRVACTGCRSYRGKRSLTQVHLCK